MTVRLLAAYDKYPINAIVTLDAGTEAGLVAAKLADTNTTGGVPYVAPRLPNQRYNAQIEVDPNSGNTTGIVGADNRPIQFPGKIALPKWRAALGKMRNGQATARLALVGSSSVLGHGAGTRDKNAVSRLAQMLNSYYAPATAGSIFGGGYANAANLATFDTRLVLGSGWVASTADSPLGQFAFLNNTNTTGLLQFTPETAFNTAVIYSERSTTSGTFTISIDGGVTPLQTVNASGSDTLQATVVTGLTLGLNTLTIKPTALGTTGNCIHAIRTYNTAARSIEVFQMAHSGGTADNFLATGKPWSAYNAINTYAPDLALFVVASNVWTTGQSLSTFKTSMQSLINRLKEKGDVGIVAGVPTDASITPLSVQQTYIDAAQDIALANGLPFLDLWRRFGTWEQANSLGLVFDAAHLNGAGYSDFAMPIFKFITEI